MRRPKSKSKSKSRRKPKPKSQPQNQSQSQSQSPSEPQAKPKPQSQPPSPPGPKAQTRATTQPVALVLADIPERVHLRELQQALNALRDDIAEIDLEIETRRDELATFEATYHARLQAEHEQLRRTEQWVHHFERWTELLREETRQPIVIKAEKIEARRARELEAQAQRQRLESEKSETHEEAKGAVKTSDERLKSSYRALARRFHPDLARTEDERLRFSDLMARINELYHAGDLGRLEAMAEQAKGGEVEGAELGIDEQLALLEQRLAWFRMVLSNLKDERDAIEQSPSCELWRNVQQAEAAERDLIVEIKKELQQRVEKSYSLVATAAHMLESAVSEFNRRHAAEKAVATRSKQAQALERGFDPLADKRLVRLGLEELRDLHVSPEAHRLSLALEEQMATRPGVLRLLLFTHIAELSPFPLPGLARYDDLVLRFDDLARKDEAPLSLEQALIAADTLVEFGVRRASEKVAHMGLRFQSDTVRDAVLVLQKSPLVRSELKRVLVRLGEHEECTSCHEHVFTVPLFRTRGLDDLRAIVCPSCGHALRSYWMPIGKDVQAVLNDAFLDLEIISEWSFHIGRGSVALQLLPMQVESMRLVDLKRRVFDDVFARHALELTLEQLELWQDKKRLRDTLPLSELLDQTLVLRFTADVKQSEADALEIVRHRVRTRFQGGG